MLMGESALIVEQCEMIDSEYTGHMTDQSDQFDDVNIIALLQKTGFHQYSAFGQRTSQNSSQVSQVSWASSKRVI